MVCGSWEEERIIPEYSHCFTDALVSSSSSSFSSSLRISGAMHGVSAVYPHLQTEVVSTFAGPQVGHSFSKVALVLTIITLITSCICRFWCTAVRFISVD